METSLHRQLKDLYAGPRDRCEVKLRNYRIDVVRKRRGGDQLVEIQHGSLSAIRSKIARLVKDHRVLVVKPIVMRKQLIKLDGPEGDVVSRRLSPKRGQLLDVFDELVYFAGLFPHQRLAIEVIGVEIEEWRYPGHGRRRRWRERDFQIADQKLVEADKPRTLRTASDLRRFVDVKLPAPFHTGHLAEALAVDRWVAQRVGLLLA